MNFGTYLRDLRNKNKFSLHDVYNKCGITNSRLSRIENNESINLEPDELRKLADFYNVNIISFLMMAGYLKESDLVDYQLVFNQVNALTENEKECIQNLIGLLVNNKKIKEVQK